MRHLKWNMCLLHLAYFLGLITEEYADECEENDFQLVSRSEALEKLLEVANGPRLEELGLGELELARWTDVAFGLQVFAHRSDRHIYHIHVLTPLYRVWLLTIILMGLSTCSMSSMLLR